MRKGDLRKAAFLETAEELFFTRGYAATTVNDIIASQHCSKGSFYHHFECKLDVLTALCRAHASQARARYLSASNGEMTSLQKMNLLLSALFPVQQAEEKLCGLLIELISAPEGEQVLSVFFETLRVSFLGEYQSLLQALCDEGQAFLPIRGLDELTFAAYQAQCRQLLKLGAEMSLGHPPLPGSASPADILAALRYLMERTLDLPFGSVLITTEAELSDCLSRCAEFARSVRPADQEAEAARTQLSLL